LLVSSNVEVIVRFKFSRSAMYRFKVTSKSVFAPDSSENVRCAGTFCSWQIETLRRISGLKNAHIPISHGRNTRLGAFIRTGDRVA
jgi:hypothetical protein